MRGVTWVVARTASSRPTLMHIFKGGDKTACGLDLSGWSKAYSVVPISQIACKRCSASHS